MKQGNMSCMGFQVAIMVKNQPAKAGDMRNTGSIPGQEDSLEKEQWQPTPIFLPEESHGQRSLVGYSQ